MSLALSLFVAAQLVTTGTADRGQSPSVRSSGAATATVIASARILAPARVQRDPTTGALIVDEPKASVQVSRDKSGFVWIDFS